jgi:hypothetical protein
VQVLHKKLGCLPSFIYIYIKQNKLIMSIVIALIIVLAVGALISKYYPKPNKTIVVTPEETLPEHTVVIEPLVDTPPVITTKPSDEAAKMDAKPKKKKPQHKKSAKKANA